MASATQAQGDRSPLPGKDKSVKFYPNPATTQITFDLQGKYQQGLSIAIYSFLGKKNARNPTGVGHNNDCSHQF